MSTDKQATEVVAMVLEGCGFSGFDFATGFTLRFTSRKWREVRVVLDGEWRLGNEEQWRALLDAFPVTSVEPAEPVQAATLAALRWRNGSTVESAWVNEASLHIHFDKKREKRAKTE